MSALPMQANSEYATVKGFALRACLWTGFDAVLGTLFITKNGSVLVPEQLLADTEAPILNPRCRWTVDGLLKQQRGHFQQARLRHIKRPQRPKTI